MNGQKGYFVRYIYERIRFEVRLGTDRLVAIRPVNLREADRPDVKWMYGDLCRLIGLREDEDEELRNKSGFLGTLRLRGRDSAWRVEVQGGVHQIKPWNLRVCADDDERGILAPGFGLVPQIFVAGSAGVTLVLLLGACLAVADLHRPAAADFETPPEEFEGGFHLKVAARFIAGPVPETAAGVNTLFICGAVHVWTWLLLWGTLWGCCRLHRPLWDPQVTFPKVSELCLGQTCAKQLFRLGLGSVGALSFAAVWLHKELVIPHLPYGTRENVENTVFWGVVGAAGVGALAVFPAKERRTWETLAHYCAGAVVVWSTYQHLTATKALYMPTVAGASWFDFDRELEPQEPQEPQEPVYIDSEFLRHPLVSSAYLMRYYVLNRLPWGLLMLPVLQHIFEHMPESSKVSGQTLIQSLASWTQWFLVFSCAVIHLSYGPELLVACLMNTPSGESPEP